MKVVVLYIYPLDGAEGHLDHAVKFLESYHACPPGMDHDTAIICNGAPASDEARFLFSSLPHCFLLERDGAGKDIGGYQFAAKNVPCDLMVFFGGNSYLKRPGWLVRMVEAWRRHGDTLYGAMGNQGHLALGVHPHIRTTGFWMSPALLNRYPIQVNHNGSHGPRYEFEHGASGLSTWITRLGKTPRVVAWSGDYTLTNCDTIPNGFHRGDQSNLLCGDRLTQPPYWAIP